MIIRQGLFFLFKVSDLWFVLIKVINVVQCESSTNEMLKEGKIYIISKLLCASIILTFAK